MAASGTGQTVVRGVIRNTAMNYAGKLVSVAGWVLLTPFILHHIGSSMYGIWVLVGTVVGYGSLVEFGIANAITKYVAQHAERGEIEDASGVISTAIFLYLGLGLVVVGATALLAPSFGALFDLPAEHRATATWVVMLSGLSLGLSLPCSAPGAVLRALQRFDLINVIVIASTLLGAGATVLVLLLGGGVIGLVAVTVAVMVLMQLPAIWFIRRVAPELRIGPRFVRRAALRKVASFSSSIFLLRVGGKLESGTDEVVIGAMLTVSSVTPYSLARKLSTLPQLVTDQFLTVIVPLASKLEAGDDQRRLRSLYIVSTRMTLAVCIPIAAALMFLAGPVLALWVGEQYAAYADLVVILTLATVIDLSVWPAGQLLQGIARHRVTAIASVCAGVLNLGLSLVLVRSLGLTGVALGTLVPTTLICIGWVTPYASRLLHVPLRQTISDIYVPVLLPLVPMVLVELGLRQLLDPSPLGLLLTAAAGMSAYTAVYLSLAATSMERRVVRTVAGDAMRVAELRLSR